MDRSRRTFVIVFTVNIFFPVLLLLFPAFDKQKLEMERLTDGMQTTARKRQYMEAFPVTTQDFKRFVRMLYGGLAQRISAPGLTFRSTAQSVTFSACIVTNITSEMQGINRGLFIIGCPRAGVDFLRLYALVLPPSTPVPLATGGGPYGASLFTLNSSFNQLIQTSFTTGVSPDVEKFYGTIGMGSRIDVNALLSSVTNLSLGGGFIGAIVPSWTFRSSITPALILQSAVDKKNVQSGPFGVNDGVSYVQAGDIVREPVPTPFFAKSLPLNRRCVYSTSEAVTTQFSRAGQFPLFPSGPPGTAPIDTTAWKNNENPVAFFIVQPGTSTANSLIVGATMQNNRFYSAWLADVPVVFSQMGDVAVYDGCSVSGSINVQAASTTVLPFINFSVSVVHLFATYDTAVGAPSRYLINATDEVTIACKPFCPTKSTSGALAVGSLQFQFEIPRSTQSASSDIGMYVASIIIPNLSIDESATTFATTGTAPSLVPTAFGYTYTITSNLVYDVFVENDQVVNNVMCALCDQLVPNVAVKVDYQAPTLAIPKGSQSQFANPVFPGIISDEEWVTVENWWSRGNQDVIPVRPVNLLTTKDLFAAHKELDKWINET